MDEETEPGYNSVYEADVLTTIPTSTLVKHQELLGLNFLP